MAGHFAMWPPPWERNTLLRRALAVYWLVAMIPVGLLAILVAAPAAMFSKLTDGVLQQAELAKMSVARSSSLLTAAVGRGTGTISHPYQMPTRCSKRFDVSVSRCPKGFRRRMPTIGAGPRGWMNFVESHIVCARRMANYALQRSHSRVTPRAEGTHGARHAARR